MSQKHVTFLLFISIFIQTFVATTSKEDEGQWMKGTLYTKIEGIPPEKAWLFVQDFCNAYKVFPLKASFCPNDDPQHVEVGHRRFMLFESDSGHITWEKQRLEGIDRVNRVITYRILENTNGLSYYRSIMSVLPDKHGSQLKWEYVAKSNVLTPEIFRAILLSTAQTAATNIKNLASSSSMSKSSFF